MKKILKWSGIVFLALVFIAAVFGEKKGDGGGKVEDTSAPVAEKKKETIKFTAVELFDAYEENEVATDERIKGKTIEVTGTVQGIDKDAFDHIVIRLKTSNEFVSALMTIDEDDKAKAIAMKKGAKVLIQCAKMARFVGSPMGRDCRIM